MDYAEAATRLGSRESRKLKNNTYLQRRGENIAVRLHSTDVVTFRPDGRVIYDTGGWGTITTKQRMNEFGLRWVNVFSDRGVLYAHGPGDGTNRVSFRQTFTVEDGGKVIPDEEDAGAKVRDLRRKIANYSRAFIVGVRMGAVPPPTGGDCWFCALKDTNTGETWGELGGDKDHLHSHMSESEPYYVPSLLTRALEVQGASKSMLWTLAAQWDRLEGAKPETLARLKANDWEWKRIEKALSKYIQRQLALAV